MPAPTITKTTLVKQTLNNLHIDFTNSESNKGCGQHVMTPEVTFKTLSIWINFICKNGEPKNALNFYDLCYI